MLRESPLRVVLLYRELVFPSLVQSCQILKTESLSKGQVSCSKTVLKNSFSH